LPPDQEPRTPRRHSAPDRTRERSSATKAETAGRGEDPTRQTRGTEDPTTHTRTEEEDGSQPNEARRTTPPQDTRGSGARDTGNKEEPGKAPETGTAETGPTEAKAGREEKESIGKPHKKKRRTPTQGRNQNGTHEDAQPGGSQTPTKTPQARKGTQNTENQKKRKGGEPTRGEGTNPNTHNKQTNRQT